MAEHFLEAPGLEYKARTTSPAGYAAVVHFLRRVETIGGKIGPDARQHGWTVEIETTVVRPEFLSYDCASPGKCFAGDPS